MAIVDVDYDSLEQAKRNCDKASEEASSIASKIESVFSSLDSRVRSRVSGSIQGLSSFFKNTATDLTEFSCNIENTIYYLKILEEEQANMGFADKLFSGQNMEFQLLSFFDNPEKQEEFANMVFDVLSSYLTDEEIEKITSGKDLGENDSYLKDYKKLYDWLSTDQKEVCFEFFNGSKKNGANKTRIKLKENFIPAIAQILQAIVNKDAATSNARYPKELAIIYGNVAASNSLAHFAYGGVGRDGVVFGDNFNGLLKNGFTDCIGFVKFSYYQALSDIHKDNPEKMQEMKKNIGFSIRGLIESGRKGEDGTYIVKKRSKENQVDEIASFLEPGDVIATGDISDSTTLHVRLVTGVDKENGTFSTVESTGGVFLKKENRSISKEMIAVWAYGKRDVVIIKGDKITSMITGSPIEDVAYITYEQDSGQDSLSIGENINSIFSGDTQESFMETTIPAAIPTPTPSPDPIPAPSPEPILDNETLQYNTEAPNIPWIVSFPWLTSFIKRRKKKKKKDDSE